MRRLLKRLMHLLGLVTERRYGVVVERLRVTESKLHKSGKLAGELRAESKAWKAKAQEASRQTQQAAKARVKERSEAEKRVNDVQRMADKLRQRAADLEVLRQRLTESERQVSIAREHLMAVEVKLDILEGAANVLDARTRIVVAQRAAGAGVPA